MRQNEVDLFVRSHEISVSTNCDSTKGVITKNKCVRKDKELRNIRVNSLEKTHKNESFKTFNLVSVEQLIKDLQMI